MFIKEDGDYCYDSDYYLLCQYFFFCVYVWLEVYIQIYGLMNFNVDVKLYCDVSIVMFFLNYIINLIIYFVCFMVRRGDVLLR